MRRRCDVAPRIKICLRLDFPKLEHYFLRSSHVSTWEKEKRRRGGDICSLLFCSNPRTDRISLHQAPKDPEIRKKWFNFVAKTRQNISDLKTFHICSDHFTDADYLIPPVVAASSDVKFKRILNRNAVPSIYPSPTFDKVKSKQSEYEVVKKSGVKLPPHMMIRKMYLGN